MASFGGAVPLMYGVPRDRRFFATRDLQASKDLQASNDNLEHRFFAARDLQACEDLQASNHNLEHLIVPGQGVVTFTLTGSPNGINIIFKRDPNKVARGGKPAKDVCSADVCSLLFTLSESTAIFHWRVENPEKKLVVETEIHPIGPALCPTIPDNYGIGFSDNPLTLYWISIDSWNHTLRFGKGEMRLACVLVEIVYAEVEMLMNDVHDKYEQLKMFDVVQVDNGSQRFVRLESCWAFPVVREPGVAVIEDRLYTFDDAASPGYIEGKVSNPKSVRRVYEIGKATFSSLSKESQRLYGNIIGFSLEASFITALEYSLRDKKGLGYEILKRKLDKAKFLQNTQKTEGDYKYKEIYLRITLGSAMGDSPGIPYVMEIWPGGCGSPIHNHGGTFAIIKVLAGQIDIDLFRQLPLHNDPVAAFRHLSFQKDQITMITPHANQIHQLQNRKQHSTTCITIQCYSYPESDVDHDPYFHFVNGSSATLIEHFDPISDYNYRQFKEEVMRKWIHDGAPEMTNERMMDMWWQTYV